MKTFALLVTILLFTHTLMAQLTIRGSVKDAKGAGVYGANVFIVNSYDGASTDEDGNFSFSTSAEGELMLRVTYIGYVTVEQTLDRNNVNGLAIVLEEEFNRLNAVVISAGAFTSGNENSSEILEPLDIVTTAGATADIPGALNTLPGTQTVGETGRLFVRGGDGYETKTFIDGMEVMNEYSPTAPNTPGRSRFSPFMFKGTSFSTGGYSAEYGQALSSALILKSKDVREDNRTDIGLMSVGADVSHSRPLKNGAIAGKLEYTNLTPYFELVSQDLEWDKAPSSVNSNIMFRQELNDNNMLKIYSNLSHSSFVIYQPGFGEDDPDDRVDLSNGFSYLNATYISSPSSEWTLRSGLSYTRSRNDMAFNAMKVDEKEAGYHLKTVAVHDFTEKILLTMGGEFFRTTHTLASADENGNENTLDVAQNIGSVFAEADIFLSNEFVVRAGLRSEYNGLQDKLYLVPRVSLAYRTNSYSQFSLAYGRFNQSAPTDFLRVRNDLKDEFASHYILNYQWMKKDRTFRIETYYKTYDHLVKHGQDLFDPATYSNTGDGYARGIDLFWRDRETFRGVDYWISYSFLDTERDYRDFPETAVPAFASSHNFSAVVKYFVRSLKTQFGATYSFASARPYHNPNREGFNTGRTPAYHDLSVNVSYLAKPNVIIHGSVTNVLGVDNIFGYESSPEQNLDGEYMLRPIKQQAPRFIFLGVFITLSKDKLMNQLPVL